KTQLMTMVSGMNLFQPFSAADANHPSGTTKQTEASREYIGQLTQVIGTRAVNVIKSGMSSYELYSANLTNWSHHWQAPDVTIGSPRITLRGFSVSANSPSTYPRDRIQRVWSVRDDFSWTYEAAGMHALKLGGEALNPRVTLNLGVRYDFVWNAFAQDTTLLPWMLPGRPQDKNNVQPRLGFAYSLNDRTVLRGGAGLYYADVTSPNVEWSKSPEIIAIISATNDGRPDFAANPFKGPLPTFAQAEATYCYNNSNAPGCLVRD